MLEIISFLSNLTPESSTYDSYILFNNNASNCKLTFLFISLFGLFCAMILNPNKEK